jgi:uncharacterized membrane protein HdeD (DUF308 family)
MTKRRWLTVIWTALAAYWAADLAIQLRRPNDSNHWWMVAVPAVGIVVCAIAVFAQLRSGSES